MNTTITPNNLTAINPESGLRVVSVSLVNVIVILISVVIISVVLISVVIIRTRGSTF